MNQGMGIILWVVALLVAVHCANYPKISTQFGNTLTANDYLVSTLGLFRMTVNEPTCQLQIQNFTGPGYGVVGFYPRTALPPCRSLSISSNALRSNNNDSILSLQATQVGTQYDQVFVSIDEMGIIRINGVYSKRYQSSENWISLFRQPRQYVYSVSNLSVTLYNSLSFIQNAGSWGFSATNGELRLFRTDDVSKIARFNYTSFTLTPNNLFDYNSNSLPLANYLEFKYYSTCTPTGYLQNFQGPFVFVINPYWPQLRLLNRNGYEVAALRYPDPHCLSVVGVDYLHDTDSCMSWFCPQNTFELNGDCLAVCPLPYFHQLSKNGISRCVVNCQANLNKDSIRRICACGQVSIANCPSALKATPFGCLCPKNSYYNSFNQAVTNDSSLCYPTCGPFLFAHKDGLCVPCPKYCQICTLSQNSFNYLSCSVCEKGFKVNSEGFCIRSCPNFANSTDSACPSCTVSNCNNCSGSLFLCVSCSKPYSLFNNSCLIQCPKGFKSAFNKSTGFTCVVIPGCSAQATMINDINNQSSCFCTRNGRLSYAKSCGGIQGSCPFDFYFDYNTLQCLMCPIGCLTCVLDRNGRLECTSCRPDYSLFVTISKNHYCERNSILSICPNSYDFVQQTCSISNLNQTASSTPSRNMCFAQLSNCMVCVAGSSSECSICGQNYYLSGGKCVAACPDAATTYKFQRVCIPIQRSHCLAETTKSAYWLFAKNRLNQFADGYFYLISANFQANDYLNDPLGSIFTYLKSPDIQSKTKMVNIATSYQRCTQCEQGYGLTSRGGCQRCPFPCLECVYYSVLSAFCLRCDAEYRLTPKSTCAKLNITELPCKKGEFRNESSMCQSDCLSFLRKDRFATQDGRLYAINCTLNCPSGYAVSSFYNKNNQIRLNCSKQSGQPAVQTIMFLGSKVKLSSYSYYMLISSNQLVYASNFTVNVQALASPPSSRRLSQTNPKSGVAAYPTEFGIIIVDSSDSEAISVSLPAAKISSTSSGTNIFISNTIYGFDRSSKSFMDILLNETSHLYFYGRAYIVVAFLLTLIFLSEKINYKTDNLFITFSVIYLALPSLNIYPDSSSFNAYSFMYGFAWSTHLQFLSNPRSLTQATYWFDNYLNRSGNNAHYLLYIDNNILRNGWSIFLVLIIFVSSLLLIASVMKCFSVKKLGYTKDAKASDCLQHLRTNWSKFGFNANDFDHTKQIKYLIFFMIENSFIGIVYYCVLNMKNTSWQLAQTQSQTTFKLISIVFFALVVLYSLLRTYANRIAGLYCFKRLLLGISFAIISMKGGLDQNITLSLLLLLLVQALFIFMRYKVEFLTNYIGTCFKNQRNIASIHKNRIKIRHTIAQGRYPQPKDNRQVQTQASIPEAFQFWMMIGEELLIMVLYIFLVLVNSLKEVSILIIWIIVNVFMVNFGLQFVDLVVDFWNKTYNKHHSTSRPFERRIRSNWDHELSLKSLATTADL